MGRYTLERGEAAAGGHTRPAAGTYTLDRFDRTFGKDGRRYTTARFDAVFGSQSGRGEVYGPPAPTPEQKEIWEEAALERNTAKKKSSSGAGDTVIRALADQEKNNHDDRLRERDRTQEYFDRLSGSYWTDTLADFGNQAQALMNPFANMNTKLGFDSDDNKNLQREVEQQAFEKRYSFEKIFGEDAYKQLMESKASELGNPQMKGVNLEIESKYKKYKAERDFIEQANPSIPVMENVSNDTYDQQKQIDKQLAKTNLSLMKSFDYDYEQEKKRLDELLAASTLSEKTPYLQWQIVQQKRVVEALEDLERDATLIALSRMNFETPLIPAISPVEMQEARVMTLADLAADFDGRRAVFKELFGDVDYDRILLQKIHEVEEKAPSLKALYNQYKNRLDVSNQQLYQVYDTETGRQTLEEHGHTPEKINRFGGLLTWASDEDKQIAKDIREAEFIQKRAKAEKILNTEPEVAEQIRDAYDLLNMFSPDDVSSERVTELFDKVGRGDGWLERLQDMRENILNQLNEQGYDTDALMEIYTERRNQQKVQADRNRIAKEANEIGPGILHGLGSVLASPEKLRGALYAVGKAAEEFVTGEKQYVDPNSPFFWASQYQSAVRDAQMEPAPEWGKFLYRLGMSAADFVSTLPFGSVGATAIMASSAAGDTAYELAQAGAPNEQIALATLAAGVLEVLFAQVDFGEITRFAAKQPSTVRQRIGNMFRSLAAAGSEKLVSELADDLADYLISDLTHGQSAHERAVYAYIQQGMTLEEADWQATLDYIRELSLSFADTAVLEALQSFGP